METIMSLDERKQQEVVLAKHIAAIYRHIKNERKRTTQNSRA
jgi:hypothetical protein